MGIGKTDNKFKIWDNLLDVIFSFILLEEAVESLCAPVFLKKKQQEV